MKNDSSRFGHIIQLFTVLLTAILISLFFGVLMLVGKIQGTARVVNYAGLVRGKTQRIVKLEISGTPEDDLLGDVASYIEGLRFGSSRSLLWGGGGGGGVGGGGGGGGGGPAEPGASWTTRIFRPR